ncbi:MAG: PorT family protein [Chitinophagaceae bacterium]|nr:PorT family protein [Chitinophagaceae bacterium]
MKKLLATSFLILSLYAALAQKTTDTTVLNMMGNTPPATPAKWNSVDLSNRSNDHFMLQYGFDKWSGINDSTTPSGFSRHFNMYFMLDKPFKNNPKFSVGLGVGVGSSNMFFKNKSIDLKSGSTRLPFSKLDSVNHFKKYKLTTVFLEAPIELRYNSNPLNSNKGFKMALGVKIGTMVNAHTKGKTLVDKNGKTVNDFIMKENNKRLFNSTRFALTGRVGFGIIALQGSYQVTALLKDGAGPVINPYSIGIAISGL